MVYTLTMNPSVDYVVRLDKLKEGLTNRSLSEEYYIGGKGINVSFVLAELGVKSTALGFTAGFTGEEIEKRILDSGIDSEFIRLKEGASRINIKLCSCDETEINGRGPVISDDELSRLMRRIEKLRDGDTLVLAGSIPDSVPDDIYERILQSVSNKNIRTIVDASGELLRRCLSMKPFLIKPNKQEVSELFCREINSDEDIRDCGEALKNLGAQNVIISLGGDGAVLFGDDGGVYHCGTVKGITESTVGAGDSMVAGFIAGYDKTGDPGYALKLGTACGNATAFSKGLAKKEMIQKIIKCSDLKIVKG